MKVEFTYQLKIDDTIVKTATEAALGKTINEAVANARERCRAVEKQYRQSFPMNM